MATLLTYFAYFKGWIFADFENISPQEAYALLAEPNDIIIVDVRSSEAFAEDHIKGAISVPFEILDIHNGLVKSKRKILVYSERGELSVEASRLIAKPGFEVLNLEGGVVFWIRAGYELVK